MESVLWNVADLRIAYLKNARVIQRCFENTISIETEQEEWYPKTRQGGPR